MKKKLIFVIVPLICAVIAGAVAYSSTRKDNAPVASSDSVITEQKQDEGGLPDVKNPEVSKEEGKVSISNVSQDGGMVYVRTVVEGVAQGNCVIEFRKQGFQTVSRTAPLVPVTSYHACEGFGISKQDLPTKGDWTISVKLENGNTSAEKVFNVN
ncbi:MAG: hypothetical protein AAB423_03285 [Patescibacteria group bacterium]